MGLGTADALQLRRLCASGVFWWREGMVCKHGPGLSCYRVNSCLVSMETKPDLGWGVPKQPFLVVLI